MGHTVHGKRLRYKKVGSNLYFEYSESNRRWSIRDDKFKTKAALEENLAVCLSDTMQLKWEQLDNSGNFVPFTDIIVKHRCKGMY